MFARFFVLACFCLCYSQAAIAQPSSSELRIGSDAVLMLLNELKERSGDREDTLADHYEKDVPRFVFIPGVLGSRLTVRNPGESKFHEVWGSAVSGDIRQYPGQEVQADPIDSIDLIVHRQDVYGAALSTLAQLSLSDPGLLSLFGYDWRDDNIRSAIMLQEWFCKRRDQFSGRKIVIIAHSMGGLVAKYWYKNVRPLGCPYEGGSAPSDWIDVSELIFLGVPFYGAPAALKALADGHPLIAHDNGSVFGAVLSEIDQSTVSAELNKNGASFLSSYQLLPIYGEDCFQHHDAPAPAALFNRIVGGTPTPVNTLFSAAAWKAWGWPRHIPEYLAVDFYSTFLPNALSNAKNFLCEMSEYDPAVDVRTTYIYGQSRNPDTPLAFEAVNEAGKMTLSRPCSALGDACLGGGDGMVPEFVARDKWSKAAASSRVTPEGHMSLLASDQLQYYVKNMMDAITTQVAYRVMIGSDFDYSTVRSAAIRQGTIIPWNRPTCDVCGENITAAAFADINRAVVAAKSIDPDMLSTYADMADNVQEASKWASAAYLSTSPASAAFRNKVEAAAYADYYSGNIYAAIDAAQWVISDAERNDPNEQRLIRLYNFAGAAFAHAGDVTAAKGNWLKAKELGDTEAIFKIMSLGGSEYLRHAP